MQAYLLYIDLLAGRTNKVQKSGATTAPHFHKAAFLNETVQFLKSEI
jgi:hypothetical protein